MAKYRSKLFPSEISDAILFGDDGLPKLRAAFEGTDFYGGYDKNGRIDRILIGAPSPMWALKGEWVIRNSFGEFGLVSPDIFPKRYEPVDHEGNLTLRTRPARETAAASASCEYCGCTEAAACETPAGPCCWVKLKAVGDGADLCSAPLCVLMYAAQEAHKVLAQVADKHLADCDPHIRLAARVTLAELSFALKNGVRR